MQKPPAGRPRYNTFADQPDWIYSLENFPPERNKEVITIEVWLAQENRKPREPNQRASKICRAITMR
jgi:hypothetical protein